VNHAEQLANRIIDELMAMGLRFPPFTISRDQVVASIASTIADALDAKDAEIKRLRTALANLVSSHDGYSMGVGPCICAAHEDASALLGVNRDGVKIKEPSE